MRLVQEITPKFVAIRMDETRHWTDDIKSRVKVIYSHYLFDEHQCTHCCEITPSYWLMWVGFDIEMEDPEAEIPDDLYEAIESAYQSNALENSGYHHCRVIDRIKDEDMKKVFMEGDELEKRSDGYSYREIFGVVCEAWQENPGW